MLMVGKHPGWVAGIMALGLWVALTGCVSVRDEVAARPGQSWVAPDGEMSVPPAAMSPSPNPGWAGEPLALDRWVDMALENNPATRLSWYAAKARAAQLGQQESRFWPTAGVGVNLTREKQREVGLGPGAAISSGTYWSTYYGPTLELNWLLWDFGRREADVETARQTLYAANFGYNQTLQDVVLAVQNAFYQLHGAQASVLASEATIAEARVAWESADAKLRSGMGNKQDALRALADLRTAEFGLEASRAAVERNRAKLARAVGLPPSQHIRITLDEAGFAALIEQQTVIEEQMALALRQRPVLMARYAEMRAAESTTRAAERDYFPTVHAGGVAQWQEYSGAVGNPSNNYQAGIALQWSLFEGFNRRYRILETKAEERVRREAVRATELAILADVWAFYYAYLAAGREIRAAEAAFVASAESYEANRRGYETGLNNLTDLLSARRTLADARDQRIRAQVNLATALAGLAHATGSLTLGLSP